MKLISEKRLEKASHCYSQIYSGKEHRDSYEARFFSDRLKLWYLKFQLPIPSSIHNLFTCLFKKYLHKKEQVTITYTILDVKNYTKNWIQTWMEIEKLEDESLNNIIFFPVSTLKKFTITWIYFLEVLDHYYHLNTLIKNRYFLVISH